MNCIHCGTESGTRHEAYCNANDAAIGPLHSGNKYLRNIHDVDGKVDVYAVLEAFAVACPARQHAVKKLLCAGLRGKGDALQDLSEARDAVLRAIDMERHRIGGRKRPNARGEPTKEAKE